MLMGLTECEMATYVLPPLRSHLVTTSPTKPEPIVLIVDDEDAVRQMMTRALQESGFRVIAAQDGAAAWDLLQAGASVQAVITDVAMPGMTGLELAAKVATLPNAPPVILVSGHRRDSLQEIPFLPKPFGPDQLATFVDQVLGRWPADRFVH
jgi:CheY-like chemotaxis protein